MESFAPTQWRASYPSMARLLVMCLCIGADAALEHPSWVHGGGCEPFSEKGGELLWDELVEVRALPKGAETFVCYDGRYSKADEADDARVGHIKTDAAGGGVLLVENFLSEHEVEHMRHLTTTWAAKSQDEGGWRVAYGVGKQFEVNFDLSSAQSGHLATHPAFDDEILNAVEKRVADFLQIPATMFENYLQLMMETGAHAPGVHHDKNNALVRRATALMYLSGGPPIAPPSGSTHAIGGRAPSEMPLLGGESLFPALPRTKPSMRGPKQTRLSKKFKGRVSRTMRELAADDAWPDLSVDSGDPLHSEIMELCAKASSPAAFDGEDGEGPMLAVAPMPGRAVFWWHERPYMNDTGVREVSGDILPDMWHVGCPVLGGVKTALQKFKNYGPEDGNCKKLRWCDEAWKRILNRSSQSEGLTNSEL